MSVPNCPRPETFAELRVRWPEAAAALEKLARTPGAEFDPDDLLFVPPFEDDDRRIALRVLTSSPHREVADEVVLRDGLVTVVQDLLDVP